VTTGRSIVSTCAARAALAGNPSDGYGGAVVAIPLPDLTAMAALEESHSGAFVHHSSDPELSAVVDATVAAYADLFGSVPPVELSLSTNIPRSVGLAGSSALIIATLRALRAFDSERWEPIPLATAALAVERERMGIEAGLQDRLVQSVGRPVSMTFDPVGFEPLDLDERFQLFVAWSPEAAETSDTVHRSLRRRFDGGDSTVRTAMGELRIQAGRARRGILSGDPKLLADAMHRTLAIRLDITEVPEAQRHLIEIGRAAGAALNSAGSGGSVVGLARHEHHLADVLTAYRDAGVDVQVVSDTT
jgi:glucuronokinase